MEKRICVFLDFLGWKEKIKAISDIQKSNEIYNILINCFDQIDGGQSREAMLKFNKDYSGDDSSFEKAIENHCNKIDLQFTMVSDCVVISMRYPTDDEGYKECLTMLYMLIATQHLMLNNSVPYLMRGGIACGDLVHENTKTTFGHPVNLVYGKAQIEALQLEKEAQFPRIIFYDDNLYNNLKQYVKNPLQGDSQSEKTFNCIKKDKFTIKDAREINKHPQKVDDKVDCYFLDYTTPEYLSIGFVLSKEDLLQYGKDRSIDLFDSHYYPIIEKLKIEMEKHKEEQKVYEKYEWLFKRLEKNIPKAKECLIAKTRQDIQARENPF